MQRYISYDEESKHHSVLPPSADAKMGPVEETIQETEAADRTQDTEIIASSICRRRELDALLATFKTQSRQHVWLASIAFLLAFGFLFFGVLALVLYADMSRQAGHPVHLAVDFSVAAWGIVSTWQNGGGELAVSGLTPLLLLLGAIPLASRVKRERKRLIRQLAQYEDVRAVGPLIEALYLRDRAVSAIAIPRLIELLPRMQTQDAALLNADQRLLLQLYIGRSRRSRLHDNDELTVAMVQACVHIGNGKELPTIRRLATGKGSQDSEGSVQEAARAYLQEVQTREETVRASQMLLRGSSSAQLPADTLLRPSVGTEEAAPEQLLRPSAQGQSL